MTEEKQKVTCNDITGDKIQSKSNSDLYRKGWDLIFGENKNNNNQGNDDVKTKGFFELKHNNKILTEAIQFDHGNNYGQVVIMAGGPASGKGFVKDYILDVANYKTRDVDELKKKHLNLLKSKYKQNKEFTEEELKILKPLLEKHNLDVKSYLGDSEQLSLLHEFVKKRINIKLNLTHEIRFFMKK